MLAIVLAATLHFDFPAVQVGVAENESGPTGATVFYFPKPVMAVVDVRGGAPGTINTDALKLSYDSAFVDAIAFSGGSSYGLAVATGAADEIKKRSANAGDWENIATVAGAIVFDLGPRRYNTVTPDYELGQVALRRAKNGEFPLGAHGAGRFVLQGGYWGDDERQHSGEGGAFRQAGPTKLAVFTVVNAVGSIVDRQGNIVRCAKPPCGTIADRFERRLTALAPSEPPSTPTHDTTITLVVTNQKLPIWALQRIAIHVHSSMARAIQPFNTTNDGDTLFAVTTNEIENPKMGITDLGVIAAETAWDAILSSVPELDPADDRPPIRLDAAALDRFAGEYEFAPGARAMVRRDGDRLTITATKRSYYLAQNQAMDLVPLSSTDFRIKGARNDRLTFDSNGLVINPGHWPIAAKRVTPTR
jgi:L-aminopeptidase/D-esterase-like protein